MAEGLVEAAVPERVLESIKKSIRQSSARGESGWRSAPRSEDTLTGHWGGAVQTGWSPMLEESGYFWRWRIEYRKFGGGNQKSSEEKPTGADGIVQLEVERSRVEVSPAHPGTVSLENVEVEYIFRKGALFQAKRIDSTERERLLGQLEDIEKLTPGNGCYFEYGPDQYRATSAQKVADVDGFTKRIADTDFPRLGDFLADEFLPCKIGVEGMYVDFDSEPHEFYFPKLTRQIARAQAQLRHGLRIKVAGFRMVPFLERP